MSQTFTGAGTTAAGPQGPGPSLLTMVRELSTRMQQFVLCTPEPGALQTTLVCQPLRQNFPNNIPQLNAWFYGPAGVDPANVGAERRARSWTQSNATVTFFDPGWPTAPLIGPYECHIRYQRSRLAEAINDGVGQLGLTWYRETIDESLVTAKDKWQYTIPASQNWAQVSHVEIQYSTDSNLIGYPYADAVYLNWRPRRSVDVTGQEAWVIDFGLLPPPGRILRVFGEAFYSDLLADTDALAIAGKWRRPAMTWIYRWAQFNLNDWKSNASSSLDTQTVRTKALQDLQQAKEDVLAQAPSHQPGRIITPGRGDATIAAARNDRDYLGAFGSMH